MPSETKKIINIGDLEDLGSIQSDISDKKLLYKVKDKNEEIRRTIFHFVTHLLAFIIIGPWIFMQFSKANISETYSTIVSVVIGFYFGRALFKDRN